VALERESTEPGTGEELPLDPLERVQLSERICAAVITAAELHSATALKSCLPELRAEGGDAARLAGEIRRLMRSYDMDAIQRLVCRVVVPHAPDSGKIVHESGSS
jgi:hypothetical protein